MENSIVNNKLSFIWISDYIVMAVLIHITVFFRLFM